MENWCCERLLTFHVVVVITLLTINSDHVLSICYGEVTQHIVYTLILSAILRHSGIHMPTSRTWTHRPDICLLNHQQQNWDLNTNLSYTSAQIFPLHHTNLTEGSSRAVINFLNLQSLEWQSQIFMVGQFLFTVDKEQRKLKETFHWWEPRYHHHDTVGSIIGVQLMKHIM